MFFTITAFQPAYLPCSSTTTLFGFRNFTIATTPVSRRRPRRFAQCFCTLQACGTSQLSPARVDTGSIVIVHWYESWRASDMASNTSLCIFYQYNVDDAGQPFTDGFHLEEWQQIYILTLRKMVWENSEGVLSTCDGIKTPAHLQLWVEGDPVVVDMQLKDVFVGCEQTVNIFVTHFRAAGPDTPFISAEAVQVAAADAQRNASRRLEADLRQAEADVRRIDNELQKALSIVSMLMQIEVEKWEDESPSKLANHAEFKSRLVDAYHARKGNLLVRCMVTGKYLPHEYVIGAHILGVKMKKLGDMFLGIDIDNPQNGLLWCKPLEVAWGKNKFCFAACPEEGTFMFLLLDDKLQHVNLATYAAQLSKAKDLPKIVQDKLGDLTFGNLHRTKMEFAPQSQRPYKRALLFMSG